MRDFPRQMGMRIRETRRAWAEGQLDMVVDTRSEVIIERKDQRSFVFHFLAVGRTRGLYGTWYPYTNCTMREAKRRFRNEYGLIGARLTFSLAE